MKAILMSILPKWCELIASGMKTVEVRKSKPKIDVPFKVYIYCTKDEPLYRSGEKFWCKKAGEFGNGKIIGEFKCDNINTIELCRGDIIETGRCETKYVAAESACMNYSDFLRYLGDRIGYGYHISDLVIYDKPKELHDFRSICCEYDKERPRCGDCEYYYYESNESVGHYEECSCDGMKHIARPPQSWCYVKEVGQ